MQNSDHLLMIQPVNFGFNAETAVNNTFQKKGEKDRGQKMCDKAISMDPSLENLRRKKEIVGL